MTARLEILYLTKIIRAFIKEHFLNIIFIASLFLLAGVILIRYPQTLFEFLVFLIMWLQLELAYTQWFLDTIRRKPFLIIDSMKIGDSKLFLYIKNIGETPARYVIIDVWSIKAELFEIYELLLYIKSLLIRKLPAEWCGYYNKHYSEIEVPPGGTRLIEIDLSKVLALISACAKHKDSLALFEICYDKPFFYPSPCTYALVADLSSKFSVRWQSDLKEEPLKILTKVYEILDDAYLLYKAYRIHIKYEKLKRLLSIE